MARQMNPSRFEQRCRDLRFTDQVRQALRRYWVEGKPAEVVAQETDRTPGAVYALSQRMEEKCRLYDQSRAKDGADENRQSLTEAALELKECVENYQGGALGLTPESGDRDRLVGKRLVLDDYKDVILARRRARG